MFKVLKDLIVDMDSFLAGINAVKPYLIRRRGMEKEIPQSSEERRKLDDVVRCILCACCTASCPVMSYNNNYVGPAAIVWMYRYIFESRDEAYEERLKLANDPNGVWPCANHFECTRVCPKQIPITRSIDTIKSEIEKEAGLLPRPMGDGGPQD